MITELKLDHVKFSLDVDLRTFRPLKMVFKYNVEACTLDSQEVVQLCNLLAPVMVAHKYKLTAEEVALVEKHRADQAAREAATKREVRIKELQDELRKLRAETETAVHARVCGCRACSGS